ncbi:MAG TPA: molecular chaperone DjiA [Afifellaceae bacterium]|nr:molecular chaperone DjiA [Afifellaceae bacterium]
MTFWTRIGDVIADSAGALSAAVAAFAVTLRGGGSGTRRKVGFTIAMIALSAKMAKADGVVTRDEIDAFLQIFEIPAGEERNVSRLFNLAIADIAGFEAYARSVGRMFPEDPDMLEDILDGLFHIAKADGVVHERELAYLQRVAEIFGFDDHDFARLRERHVVGAAGDPYLIIGADPGWDDARLKAHYRRLVAENHPDRHIALGVPEEFVRIATERLAAINAAWETIERQRAGRRRGKEQRQ